MWRYNSFPILPSNNISSKDTSTRGWLSFPKVEIPPICLSQYCSESEAPFYTKISIPWSDYQESEYSEKIDGLEQMMVELSGEVTFCHKNHEVGFQQHFSSNQIARQRSQQYEVYHQSIQNSLLLLWRILYILLIIFLFTLSLPKDAETRLRWVCRNWSASRSGGGSSLSWLVESSGATSGDSGRGGLESWSPWSVSGAKILSIVSFSLVGFVIVLSY